MAVTALTGGVRIRVYADFDYVGAGIGPAGLGQSQANNPGQGQGLNPQIVGNAQTMRQQVGEEVLGAGGAITLAQIQTALVAIANDLAGASGTPIITPAILAQINAWSTGGP